MRLVSKIVLRISIAVVFLFGLWGIFFYYTILDEVDDELNDALEVYSDQIIKRTLAGVELPPKIDGSNNVYNIETISQEHALHAEPVIYKDTLIYIRERREKEAARVLRTIFEDEKGQYYRLTVYTPTIEKEDLLEAIFGMLAILYALLLLTLIVINVWVFNRSLKPLYVLLDWVDKYQLGGENQPLDNDTNVKEFRKLNEALVRHINKAEKSFSEQKLFIGNASHEMQTPLSICLNRLEWLIDRPNLEEEQLSELLKIKQTLRYLARLNRSLLFLSKIENRQFPESTEIEIANLVEEQLVDYQEIYEHKNIETTVVAQGRVTLRMNETLAISLFTNLLRNAFVHTAEGGKIKIEIAPHRVLLSNSDNNGEGALDGEKIFTRFHQRRKKEGTTGLGLVITKSICDTYGIAINYSYSNGFHHFELTF